MKEKLLAGTLCWCLVWNAQAESPKTVDQVIAFSQTKTREYKSWSADVHHLASEFGTAVPSDGTVLWKSPDLVRIQAKTEMLGESTSLLIVIGRDRVLWQQNTARGGSAVLKADLAKVSWEERAEGGVAVSLLQAVGFTELWNELRESFEFSVGPSEEIMGQSMYVLKGSLKKSAVTKDALEKFQSVSGEARVVIGEQDGFVYAVEQKMEFAEKSDPANPLVRAAGFEFHNVKFNVDAPDEQFVYQPPAGIQVEELKSRSGNWKPKEATSEEAVPRPEPSAATPPKAAPAPTKPAKPHPLSDKDVALINEVGAPYGQITNAERLLKDGANINATDKEGWTPLHHAVCNGMQARGGEFVAFLISRGANVNVKDSTGMTPLHLTGWHGWQNDAAAKALIAAGADVNAKDNEGFTPAHIANTWSAYGIVDILSAAGAELDMYSAARLGKTERMAELLKANPRLANTPDERGEYPFSWAVVGGHVSAVKLLLDRGAKPRLEFPNDDWTILDVAQMHDKKDVLAFLCDLNPRPKPKQLNRLICAAANVGHAEIVALLLSKGANINAQDADGNTPLHLAAIHGRMEVIDILLAKGVDTHAKNKAGQTPDQATLHTDIAERIRQY